MESYCVSLSFCSLTNLHYRHFYWICLNSLNFHVDNETFSSVNIQIKFHYLFLYNSYKCHWFYLYDSFSFVHCEINTYRIFESFFDLCLSVLYLFSIVTSQIAILPIFCIAALFYPSNFHAFSSAKITCIHSKYLLVSYFGSHSDYSLLKCVILYVVWNKG